MSPPDIASILDNTKELDRLRKAQEEVIMEMNKLHKKLQTNPEVVEKEEDHSLSRLRMLYSQAKELAENEVVVSNALIGQLDALIPSGPIPAAQQRRKIAEGNEQQLLQQKKKRMKGEMDIATARMSPSMRNPLEVASGLKGEQVAARVTPDDADKDEWIVVKVIHFDREAREFDVLDEEPGEDDDGGGQRKYMLGVSRIIPFPKKNDGSSALDFSPGRHVLAVYPGTTALYKATVVPSNRKRKTDDYLLEFDDDEEDGSLPQRIVPFHKVVTLPEGHRQ